MLDRAAFLRPIAHRGLHDAGRGIIENTAAAFSAAIDKGYGIECDLQPAADGTPFVFHDLELSRLIDARGRTTDYAPAMLAALTYRAGGERIISFADFLALVDGRVPLLVEVKSEWTAPNPAFLRAIVDRAGTYRGPLALMSFDPAIMTALKVLAPNIPRGIVAELYGEDGWWVGKFDRARAFRLSHLLESGPAEPHFFSYDVRTLPTPVTRFVREVLGLPLFTWTVRTAQDRAVAAEWADAITFEGFAP